MSAKMKAWIWTAYGPPEVMQLQEVEKPEPGENEVLIKIRAATVTAGDCELRRFDVAGWIWLFVRLYMGVFKPRIKTLGQEFSGEIVRLGTGVKAWNVGDAVFVSPGMRLGGYAEYACLSEDRVMEIKSNGISFEEAATIPTGGINGLHFLRKGEVKVGDHVLINGAGGSIGTYALQIAKSWGAEVTCVDAGPKLEMLRSLGADHVIDYSRDDFTSNENTYDVIIDIVGYGSYSACLRSMKAEGRFVLGNPRLPGMLRSIWTSKVTNKRVIVALAAENRPDFRYLKELMEAGKIKSVIEKTYPFNELREAHRYVETGAKAGNVVIRVNP